MLQTGALEINTVKSGEYSVDAALNCYVNAMGGVEFGNPLLTGAKITVAENGRKEMTLSFTKSSVTIYSVTCDTFIDIAPPNPNEDRGVKSGVLGYYDKNGAIQNAEYTLSDDTAPNPRDEQVHYVDTMTFPLDEIKDVYSLTMYINSNVMGVQFCEENSKATQTTYTSRLTVDWNSLREYDGSSAGVKKSDTEFDTLPPSAAATEAATAANETVAEKIVEKDGLNIHYADGSEPIQSNNEALNTSYYAHLNMPVLIIVICVSAAILIAGIILLLSTKFEIKKRNDK